ncbi:hypothetical protein BSF44_35250 [Pseudomonas sp. ACN8]|uniref:hypothetical protein n=1 Tax=Pseudomonas sp. ACN8 TaxID=1920428 RepID=UPI000BB371B7|nr:hypothetical protein [Pseudomonas sp. ACN8]PBJ21662.1 hypothetical protein BSF44_35250 [Pseudomonas sp. ACN8]
MLKSFLFNRPDWFKHEGYWRLVQVLRIGIPAAGVLLGVGLALLDHKVQSGIGMIISSVAVLFGIHLAMYLIVWIIEGFKGGEKSS